MSKCIYTESDVTDSGAQLIITGVSLDGKSVTDSQKRFVRAFPHAAQAVSEMLKMSHHYKDDKNYGVSVGDVIWTNPGGNKHLGFCIVKNSSDESLNTKAIKLCIESARNKARTLETEYIGMDLFASDTAQEWASIVDIVESGLEEVQGVVCVPTNEALQKVLENLPGSNNFKMIKSN